MTLKRIICNALPITLLVGALFLACEGPIGPQGEPGTQGPVGPVGATGDGGSVMLAGTGEPSTNFGSAGDFYIDLSSGNLYGPKTESGWGAPLSLSGPPGQDGQDGEDGNDGKDGADGQDGQDGQDGADGSQIFAGDGPPPNTIGDEGDYYLDTENYHLYGPKTGSSWGSFLNLQGPPGTANVRYSQWLERTWNELDNPNWKQMGIDEPAITKELLDTGVILMYIKGSGSQVFPIPYVEMVDSYRFIAFPGSIQLVARSTDGSPVDAEWIEYVRYVLIPGGMPLKIPDSFWYNYEQVQAYFDLRD